MATQLIDQNSNNMVSKNANTFEELQLDDKQNESENLLKCSAVHTLERDMPTFDYSHLVQELRNRILDESESNPGLYSQVDIEKCKTDDWFLSRFLLRHKLDSNAAFDMLKKVMRFKHESMIHTIRREDFPEEFYKIGALCPYEVDRKGNVVLYIRVKMHRKTPEIQALVNAFLYSTIDMVDETAKGRGITIVFDCAGAGLGNADMDMLLYLVSLLVNYFPKGLSYLLVHELPWILKPFWHIAKAWIAEEHRQLIKFSNSRTIYEYIDKENLPDFLGGSCKRDYRAPPPNCTTLEQGAKLWGVERKVIERVLLKFADLLPDSLERFYTSCDKFADNDETAIDNQENKTP